MRSLGMALLTAIALLVSACNEAPSRSTQARAASSTPSVSPSLSPSTSAKAKSQARRDKIAQRLIPIEEAVARLQPHVDTTIVLPRDRLAGLPHLKRWRADPTYLTWGRDFGLRHGSMKLVKGDKILILDFGLVTFDGCGGTDLAIPTHVSGQLAFVFVSRNALWSHIVWPMDAGDTTASHGLAGTFEGWQMVRLAESMEVQGEGHDLAQSC